MSTAALWLMFCSPFAGAALLWAFERASLRIDPERRLRLAAWLAAAFAALAAGALISVAPAVIAGEVQRARIDWLPVFGVGLGLRLDALALIFCGLILGIGLLVVLYARYYLSARDRTVWFYTLLLAFMGAMLGIALADNLIMLGIAWELTSLISFLLIGFWPARRDAREGARMALTLTGAGGLALLAGLLLLGWIAGSWQLDDVLKAGPTVREHAWYPVCLALVLLGAATKSAQFPFHFWLPQAMAAPTPASAYLHSATMVKAGIFLLARLYPVLSGTDLWFVAVTTMGAATLLTGAWHAIFQHDLKGLLADQPPRTDRDAAGAGLPHGCGGCGVSSAQPRDLQGLAVHDRRHHRPRDRHPRHAQAAGPGGPDAGDRHGGHRIGSSHGGGAVTQRLFVERNVFR
jgi:multicomponent K+:H+ antiporter subunit A